MRGWHEGRKEKEKGCFGQIRGKKTWAIYGNESVVGSLRAN